MLANDKSLLRHSQLTSAFYLDGELDHVCAVCDGTVAEATAESLAAHLRHGHHINLLQYKAVFVDEKVRTGKSAKF